VTDGMAKQLGRRTRFSHAAEAHKKGDVKAPVSTVPPPSPISAGPLSVSAQPAAAQLSAAAVPADEAATLVFSLDRP